MAIDIYLVISDERGVTLQGESPSPVYNPYTKATVAKPTEIASVDGMTEQTYSFTSGGTGTGGGKVVFDPFVIDKPVDNISQTTFLAHASGVAWKFVDILFVGPGPDGGPASKPFLSYRFGTVGISQIETTSTDESPRERVSLVFGTFQIGYQLYKADGSLSAFAPVGWDRIRNIKI